MFNCYDSEFFPNEPLCDQFERVTFDQRIENVRDSFINIAKQKSRGWDVAAVYRVDLGGGQLTVDTQHTFQEADDRALFADTLEELNGLVGDPDWVGRLDLTYDRGPWSFFWGISFIGSSSNDARYFENNPFPRRIAMKTWISSSRRMMSSITPLPSAANSRTSGFIARLGVSNVLDEEPPRVTTLNLGEVETIGNSAFYSQYDWLGRRYFLGLTKTF